MWSVALNIKIKIVATLFAVVTLPISIFAQGKVLSPGAQKLTAAWGELQKNPDDLEVQEQYLKAFPHDYKSFLRLFDFHRELYDGNEFIMVLSSLAKNHESEVGRLIVNLSKDAHWDADAPNYLQHETVIYGVQHTKVFATLLRQLPTAERANLVSFLAHAENFAGYPEFQKLIDRLKSLGQDSVANEFEAARAAKERR